MVTPTKTESNPEGRHNGVGFQTGHRQQAEVVAPCQEPHDGAGPGPVHQPSGPSPEPTHSLPGALARSTGHPRPWVGLGTGLCHCAMNTVMIVVATVTVSQGPSKTPPEPKPGPTLGRVTRPLDLERGMSAWAWWHHSRASPNTNPQAGSTVKAWPPQLPQPGPVLPTPGGCETPVPLADRPPRHWARTSGRAGPPPHPGAFCQGPSHCATITTVTTVTDLAPKTQPHCQARATRGAPKVVA